MKHTRSVAGGTARTPLLWTGSPEVSLRLRAGDTPSPPSGDDARTESL